MRCLSTLIVAALVGAPAGAQGDEPSVDYFAKQSQTGAVTVTRSTSRTPRDTAILWGLVGAGALGVGLGVNWHLDSSEAAGEVSSNEERTVGVWSEELQATYDRAGRSAGRARIAYAVGAVLLAGGFGWAFWTRPREQEVILVPVEGGAAASAAWSF